MTGKPGLGRRFLPAVVFSATTLCGYADPKPASSGELAEETVLTLCSRSGYPITDDLTIRINTADHIVIGAFAAFFETWSMRHAPRDPAQEAEDGYTEGELYRFAVDCVLKGDIEQSEIGVHIRILSVLQGLLTTLSAAGWEYRQASHEIRPVFL